MTTYPEVLTIPFSKDVLLSRVKAMTAKQSDVTAPAEGSTQRTSAYSEATDSDSDKLLLLTSLRSAVDSLIVFISGESFGVQSVTDTLRDDDSSFEIAIECPPRFNGSMKQPLVSAMSDYIVRYMLYQWYSVISPDIATAHFGALAFIEQNISRCFRKTDARVGDYVFPIDIWFDESFIPADNIVEVGSRIILPYTITGKIPQPVNDICMNATRNLAFVGVSEDYVSVSPLKEGTLRIDIFSHHDTSVCDSLTLTILPHV